MSTRFVAAALLAAVLAATGCAGDEATTTPNPPATSTAPPTTGAPGSDPSGPVVLPGSPIEWEVRNVTLGGARWTVAIADTPELRARGLMGVTDLGPVDGMLFVYPEPVESRFWMRDTLLYLDIAFFDASGELLAVLAMEPCTTESCPRYDPGVAFRWALEAVPGRFAGLGPGPVLVVGD